MGSYEESEKPDKCLAWEKLTGFENSITIELHSVTEFEIGRTELELIAVHLH